MRRAKIAGIVSGFASLLDSAVVLLALQGPIDADSAHESAAAGASCPLCGQSVPLPTRTKGGTLSLAECDDCDIFFEVRDDERSR